MRRPLVLVALCAVAIACGAGEVEQVQPTTSSPPTTTTTTTTTTTIPTTTTTLLTAESLPDGSTLVLEARGPVEVFASSGDPEPIRVLEATTILGTPTVVTVLEGPLDGWARVMLPGRPNGSEGWIESDRFIEHVVDGSVVVDLSDRILTYHENGDEVLTTTVAIGTEGNPTPTGFFFVTDNVTLASPASPWGPHALGLSARSDTITEFNGGDGIVGIHGTNRPESIGQAASLGCVRVPNDVIVRLHELVEVGTPVAIRA